MALLASGQTALSHLHSQASRRAGGVTDEAPWMRCLVDVLPSLLAKALGHLPSALEQPCKVQAMRCFDRQKGRTDK